jgi:hypothetical protein
MTGSGSRTRKATLPGETGGSIMRSFMLLLGLLFAIWTIPTGSLAASGGACTCITGPHIGTLPACVASAKQCEDNCRVGSEHIESNIWKGGTCSVPDQPILRFCPAFPCPNETTLPLELPILPADPASPNTHFHRAAGVICGCVHNLGSRNYSVFTNINFTFVPDATGTQLNFSIGSVTHECGLTANPRPSLLIRINSETRLYKIAELQDGQAPPAVFEPNGIHLDHSGPIYSVSLALRAYCNFPGSEDR